MMSIKKLFGLCLLLGFVWMGAGLGQGERLAAQAGSPSPQTLMPLAPPIDPSIFDIWVGDGVDNLMPAVAYNSRHNEYLVVWENDRGATRDIYARRVAADGTVRSWFAVISNAGFWNYQPDVAYNPVTDEYLVVYTFNDPATGLDLWARRIAWDGSWMSSEFVIRSEADDQWEPAVAYNSQDDEFLVVYENSWSGGLRDIAAQRVDADGTLLSWRNIATGPGTTRHLPDVAYHAASNQYLLAYTYDYPTNGDIRGKLASANLGTLSSELLIVDNTNHQVDVALAAGPDEFLAVWEDGPNVSERTIFARRIGLNGSLHSYMSIASHSGEPCVEPAVAYSPVHGYLVSWRHVLSTANWDVYARLVKPGHNSADGVEFPIDLFAERQSAPAVACSWLGECLIVEQDRWGTSAPVNYEIRGRMVRALQIYLPLTVR